MTLVIMQPGYLPWLGFFDLMLRCDTFVVFDDVQYTVRDWRNRNRVKTSTGITWLSVPVARKGVRSKTIRDVRIHNAQPWRQRHLATLQRSYARAPYFDELIERLRAAIMGKHKFLIDLDMAIIHCIRDYLGIDTPLLFASNLHVAGRKDERLVAICGLLGATCYLSPNGAKRYLREPLFEAAGIGVTWQDYEHPYYTQLWESQLGFISHLSVVDLLFNHGKDSRGILTAATRTPAGTAAIRNANDM